MLEKAQKWSPSKSSLFSFQQTQLYKLHFNSQKVYLRLFSKALSIKPLLCNLGPKNSVHFRGGIPVYIIEYQITAVQGYRSMSIDSMCHWINASSISTLVSALFTKPLEWVTHMSHYSLDAVDWHVQHETLDALQIEKTPVFLNCGFSWDTTRHYIWTARPNKLIDFPC